MRRLKIRNRGVANDPRDSRKEDKLIMGRRVSIEIDERENEVRSEVYGKILNKGKQKVSMRPTNRAIVRQRMKNKCHHHVKERRTFLQSLSKGCFDGHPKMKVSHKREKRVHLWTQSADKTRTIGVIRM